VNAFTVAIGKLQQLALSKANQRIPPPEEQLQLLRAKQGKKQRMILTLEL
jgi:hypothetical protein